MSVSTHHSSNQYVRRAPASYLRAHPSTWKEGPPLAPRLSRITAAPSALAAFRERSASRSYSRERIVEEIVTRRERTPYSAHTGARSPRDRSWDPRGSRSPLEISRFVFPRQASEGGRSGGYGTRLEVEKDRGGGGLKRQERVEITPASPALVKMREMIASLSVEGEDEEEEGEYESEEEEVSISVPILKEPLKKRLSEPAVLPLKMKPEPAESEEEDEDEDEEWEEEEEDEEDEEEEEVPKIPELVLKPDPVPTRVLIIPKITPVVPPKPSLSLVLAKREEEEDEESEESEEEHSISFTLPSPLWNSTIHASSSLPCNLVEMDDEGSDEEEDEDEEEEEDEEEGGGVAFELDSEEDEEEDEEECHQPDCSKTLSEILFSADPSDRRVLLRLLEGEGSLIGKKEVEEIRRQLERAGIIIEREKEEEELSPELVIPKAIPSVVLEHESEEDEDDWEEEEEDAPSTSGVCEDEDEEEWEEGDEELMEYGEEWTKEGFQSSTGVPSIGVGRTQSMGGTTTTNRDGVSTSVSRVAPRFANNAVNSGGTTERSSQFAAPTISSTAAANVNYRLLYEKERTENEKLRRELERSAQPNNNEVNGTSTGLPSSRRLPSRLTSSQSIAGGLTKSPSGGSMEEAERRTLERRITELELELKSLGQLRLENQRLKEENGALVRVISKMTI